MDFMHKDKNNETSLIFTFGKVLTTVVTMMMIMLLTIMMMMMMGLVFII